LAILRNVCNAEFTCRGEYELSPRRSVAPTANPLKLSFQPSVSNGAIA
jgi:hypothetical protein